MLNYQTNREKDFVEQAGIVFEQTGLPRMSGRIFGRLLIANPPYQTFNELAEALMASKGSISSMTRLLIQIGLIERFTIPGERHCCLRLRPDSLRNMIQRGLEDEIKMFRQLAERGLDILAENAPPARTWLEEMHTTYTFLEGEFPALLESYEELRKRNKLPVRHALKK